MSKNKRDKARSVQMATYVTPSLYNAIIAAAEAAGVPPSTYVYKILCNHFEVDA